VEKDINQFEIKTLSNGIRVVMEHIPFVRSVAIGVYVHSGSRHETADVNGISHFIEHMLFKGTAKRTAKNIADEMDAIGGQMNAYTAKDYTCFYARVLDEHVDIALDVLSDMYLNPKFDEGDIKKEINVVLEEISMRDDSPDDLVHDILQRGVWKGHALGRDIAGTAKTVKSFNQDVLKEYYRNRYTAENTIISVAGNFGGDIIERLEARFGGRFAARQNRQGQSPCPTKGAKYQRARVLMEKDVEQLHLCLGFEGIPYKSKDSYALSALLTFFGSGMSSRLYQRIREKHGLVYSVYSYGTSSVDTGLVMIYAALNPESYARVMELIVDEIKGLSSNRITEDHLYKVKQQLKSNYLLSLESSNSRMASLGRGLLLRGEITPPDEIIKKIDDISTEQIQTLVEGVFDLDRMSLAAVGDVLGITDGIAGQTHNDD